MSKCREAFKAHCKERVIDLESQYAIDLYFDWQAAWNARGKVDAEICQQVIDGGIYSANQQYAAAHCRNNIEEEQEK